jgi:hypothetical protein
MLNSKANRSSSHLDLKRGIEVADEYLRIHKKILRKRTAFIVEMSFVQYGKGDWQKKEMTSLPYLSFPYCYFSGN